MKLDFIELAGFRGFKEIVHFDMRAGFIVLTGRNGVGKSTVLDALDFVITGTISKYAVKDAKGGGLADHIWWAGKDESKSQYVTVGFVADDGERYVIKRSRERGVDRKWDNIAHWFCTEDSHIHISAETLMQTTLIRDETIAALSMDQPAQQRFAAVRAAIGGLTGSDHTARTGEILQVAKAASRDQEEQITKIKDELGHTLSALSEARSVAARQTDVVEAEQIIKAVAPDLSDAPGNRAAMIRRRIAERKQSVQVLMEALSRAEELQKMRFFVESESGQAEFATARADLDIARRAKDKADERLAEAQRFEAVERESDNVASHFVALLDHGQAIGLQAGHCPLCDAARSSDQFVAAIDATRSKLKERGVRAAHAAAVLEQARLAAQQAEASLKVAEQRVLELEAKRMGLSRDLESVAIAFRQWGLDASPSEPKTGHQLLLKRQEETAQLEQSLFILETSSAHDRVTMLGGLVERLRIQLEEEEAKLAAARRAVEAASQIDYAAREVPNQVLTEQFDTVMPLLKELYQRLRPHSEWREIGTDFGGRVRASLNFTVGDGRNPQFIFSSGQRRAAGLAFLLAIHLSRPWCRLRVLLLDDPVQHIDDYRALNLVEVLSAVRRTGHQVIVTVEDPALADVLCRRLRSTVNDVGKRYELIIDKNGSAAIDRQIEISPLSHVVLRTG